MKKSLITAFGCIGLSIALNAQNGWLPPQTFGNFINLCDPSPWKLVFWDNFDGTQIDRSKWVTAVTWRGMPGGDNDNWNAARSDAHMNFIFRDPNVLVGNGSVKLLVRRETNSWRCNSCANPITYRRHLSAGTIATKYMLPGNIENGFNRGRLEARLKMPPFTGAWSAFWTWYADIGVNELDIAEAWGGPVKFWGNDQRRNTYGTHAWGPDESQGQPNPLNLPYKADMGVYYFPNQGWWNMLFNRNYHRMEDYHIYTCDWDDNRLNFYIDHALVRTSWKYVFNAGYYYGDYWFNPSIASTCTPTGNYPYHVQYGYPYNTNSKSQIRIGSGTDDRAPQLNLYDILAGKDSVMNPEYLGHVEIDYVRVWQRHPEQEGRTDLCDLGAPRPVITGPEWICNGVNTTLTVTNPVPNGTFIGWSYSNQLSQTGPGNNTGITIAANSTMPYTNGWVSYKYKLPDCPVMETIYKTTSCNLRPNIGPYDVFAINTTNGNGFRQFQLFEGTYFANYEQGPYMPVFDWDIALSEGNDQCDEPVHYKLSGQFVATPLMPVQPNKNYCLTWKVTITDPQKNVVEKSGVRHLSTPISQQAGDSSVTYLDAVIIDQYAYDGAVVKRVNATNVLQEEFDDPVFMSNMIEKIRVEELAPYLSLPKEVTNLIASKQGIVRPAEQSKIYPNPTSASVAVAAKGDFADGYPIQFTVYDLTGQVRSRQALPYALGRVLNLDLSGLADAVYILEIKQGDIVERNKIVKTSR